MIKKLELCYGEDSSDGGNICSIEGKINEIIEVINKKNKR